MPSTGATASALAAGKQQNRQQDAEAFLQELPVAPGNAFAADDSVAEDEGTVIAAAGAARNAGGNQVYAQTVLSEGVESMATGRTRAARKDGMLQQFGRGAAPEDGGAFMEEDEDSALRGLL